MYIDVMFREKIDLSLIEEFEKKIYYISEDIVGFSRIEKDNIVGMKLEISDECKQVKEIEERAYQILDSEVYGLKNVKRSRIWDTKDVNSANGHEIIDRLIQENIVYIPGCGQVAYKEPLVSLFNLFDTILQKISTKIFAGTEYIFPTLLSNRVLKKVGYFDSFPNLLMFAVRLKNEISNYKEFKSEFADMPDEDITDKLLQFCTGTTYGLPPTMCYYVYDMLSGTKVKNSCFTARGKSFRYESKYYKPFERLWDFTIRETVFLGDSVFVKNHVSAYRNVVIQLMEEIGMDGYCESANDPFFLVDDTTNRINVQKMFGSKYELRMKIDKEETIAIGSFNIHGQFLAKRFNLFSTDDEEKYIYTGCIGIGLERFIFSFLSQFGIESEKWPEFIRKAMEDQSEVEKFIRKFCKEAENV